MIAYDENRRTRWQTSEQLPKQLVQQDVEIAHGRWTTGPPSVAWIIRILEPPVEVLNPIQSQEQYIRQVPLLLA